MFFRMTLIFIAPVPACLSSLMAATLQSATALLVKLYVDQVIDAGRLKTAQLPDKPRPFRELEISRRKNDSFGRGHGLFSATDKLACFSPSLTKSQPSN